MLSLKGFHILFITLSTILAAGCVVWAFGQYQATGAKGWCAFGILFVVCAALLPAYGYWFLKKMQKAGV